MKGGMGRPRMEVEMGVVPKVQNLEGYAGNCNTKATINLRFEVALEGSWDGVLDQGD